VSGCSPVPLTRRAELWIVPDAGHAETYMKAPDEYIERVATFFDAQMGGPVGQEHR